MTAVQTPRIELVARRFYDEVWNRRRYEVAEELFHPDFCTRAAPDLRGGAAKIAAIRGYHTTFPDLHVQIEDLVASDKKAAVRLMFTGTDTGGLRGRPPTGLPARSWHAEFFTFEEDRIIRDWVGGDWLGTFVQLRLIPDPWEA
jgi:predicted ester cyclase